MLDHDKETLHLGMYLGVETHGFSSRLTEMEELTVSCTIEFLNTESEGREDNDSPCVEYLFVSIPSQRYHRIIWKGVEGPCHHNPSNA